MRSKRIETLSVVIGIVLATTLIVAVSASLFSMDESIPKTITVNDKEFLEIIPVFFIGRFSNHKLTKSDKEFLQLIMTPILWMAFPIIPIYKILKLLFGKKK